MFLLNTGQFRSTSMMNCLNFSGMAPSLALSKHDLIHDMTLNKTLKNLEMADIAECSELSIKAMRL